MNYFITNFFKKNKIMNYFGWWFCWLTKSTIKDLRCGMNNLQSSFKSNLDPLNSEKESVIRNIIWNCMSIAVGALIWRAKFNRSIHQSLAFYQHFHPNDIFTWHYIHSKILIVSYSIFFSRSFWVFQVFFGFWARKLFLENSFLKNPAYLANVEATFFLANGKSWSDCD